MLLQDRRTSICQQEGRAASVHFQQATGRQAGRDGNHSKRGYEVPASTSSHTRRDHVSWRARWKGEKHKVLAEVTPSHF